MNEAATSKISMFNKQPSDPSSDQRERKTKTTVREKHPPVKVVQNQYKLLVQGMKRKPKQSAMTFTKPYPTILQAATLALILLGNAQFSSCFSPCALSIKNGSDSKVLRRATTSLWATKRKKDDSLVEGENEIKKFETEIFMRRGIASIATVGLLATLGISAPAFADEYGRETEMAFLTTGETVMICTKRGPLGACQKTERRTQENENDKSEKYFQQPTELVKRKDSEARTAESSEGNLLIERLKKQSEENSEKNELLVYQRTLMNDSVSPDFLLDLFHSLFQLALIRFLIVVCEYKSASFGPFDSQVLILNEDGRGFTLLANPQAMRLKKAGFIENKKFVKQPTQEEIDAALESGPSILDRFFGSSE
jgi:hypothetical protein